MSLNQKNNTRSSLMKNITKQNEESFGAQIISSNDDKCYNQCMKTCQEDNKINKDGCETICYSSCYMPNW